MKVLLDECVPQKLCTSFLEHECSPARRAGFGGKGNGELLTLAEAAGFHVLITVDGNIPYQQKVTGRHIALIVIAVRSNRLRDVLPYVPSCLNVLSSIKPGEVIRVG